MKGRCFLIAALACALVSFSSMVRSADAAPSADIADRGLQEVDFPRLKKLGPDVFAYEGLHSPLPSGVVINTVSLIVVSTDGVVVVDGQGDIWQTKLMIENIKKLTSQPITHVVVASDHGDHVGGNAAFKAAYPDVEFIASPVSQRRLSSTDSRPTQTVADERTLRMGETEIQILNLGRAHTGGDLAVYLPQSKVLFLGEIYLRGLFPAMRTAHPTEWISTIEKAQAMDVSWYVPGHGFIDDEAVMARDLEAFRRSIAAVVDESERLHSAGLSCDSPSNCPAASSAAWGQYEGWTASSLQAPFAINRVYREIEGTLDNEAANGAGTTAAANGPGLTELWASGQPAFGKYVTQARSRGEGADDARTQEPPRYTVQTGRELAENPLLDYAFLNLEQHYDVESARAVAEGMRSAGSGSSQALLVRIPPIATAGVETTRARVVEVLALGADGVVLPHVRSADEARTAISFFAGVDVWSPANPEGDVIAMLMVEDPDVFAELEEIANIPGYSVLACGIGSLTQALGGDRETAEMLNQKVLAHSQRAGMADMITADAESVVRRVNEGFLGLLVFGPEADSVIRLGRAAAGR